MGAGSGCAAGWRRTRHGRSRRRVEEDAPPAGGGRAAGRPCRGVEEELSVRGGERGAAAAAA